MSSALVRVRYLGDTQPGTPSYHAVYLTNNEFALEFIIPDADWLDADLRDNLEAQISPSYLKESPF